VSIRIFCGTLSELSEVIINMTTKDHVGNVRKSLRDYRELEFSIKFWRTLPEIIINMMIQTPRVIEAKSVCKKRMFIFIYKETSPSLGTSQGCREFIAFFPFRIEQSSYLPIRTPAKKLLDNPTLLGILLYVIPEYNFG